MSSTSTEAVAALEAFLVKVVDPIEAENSDLLSNPALRWDERGILSQDILKLRRTVRRAAADEGLYGQFIPKSIGGGGADAESQFAVYAHLFERSGPDRLLPYEAVATFTSGPGAGLEGLSSEVLAGVWQSVLSGESVVCFAMSESAKPPPGAPLATSARKENNDWVISGHKAWVSAGGYADWAVVYASTIADALDGSDGVTAFLVPLSAAGVKIGTPTRILGRTGGEEVDVAFNDVVVPSSHVIGTLHGGRTLAKAGGPRRAMHAMGRAVGLGTWSLNVATAYIRNAVVFGRVLREDAAVLSDLAEIATELRAARRFAEAIADAIDRNVADPTEVNMAVSFCGEAWGRAFDRTMLLCGGLSLMSSSRFFDGWDQSMIVRAAEGTATSMRLAIGQELLQRE